MIEKQVGVQCQCGIVVGMNVYAPEGEEPKPPENFKCKYCEAEELLLLHDIRPEDKRRWKCK
jgi:hypothetical protein